MMVWYHQYALDCISLSETNGLVVNSTQVGTCHGTYEILILARIQVLGRSSIATFQLHSLKHEPSYHSTSCGKTI